MWLPLALVLIPLWNYVYGIGAYDTSATIFSPEGDLKQVAYAETASGMGDPLVLYTTEEGDIFMTCIGEESTLRLDKRLSNRIQMIEEGKWFTGSGNVADCTALLRRARLYCAQFREQYGSAPTLASLASYIGQSQHKITLDGSERPLAVHGIFCGYDEGKSKPQVFLSRPSGLISKWRSVAIGRNSGIVLPKLETQLTEPMTRSRLAAAAQAAISLAIDPNEIERKHNLYACILTKHSFHVGGAKMFEWNAPMNLETGCDDAKNDLQKWIDKNFP